MEQAVPESTVPLPASSQPVGAKGENRTTQPSKKASAFAVVMLLLIFPPAAWVVIARDRSIHGWFVQLLFASSLLSLFSLVSFYTSLLPHAAELYASLNVPYTQKTVLETSIMAGIGIGILQLLYAFWFRLQIKKRSFASKIEIGLSLLLLVLNVIVSAVPMVIIVTALYPAIAKLYQGPY